MRNSLLSLAVTLALSGCGGGGGSDNQTPDNSAPTVSYTVSSQGSTGGRLSPERMTVAAGQKGSFSVLADTGYVLDDISGCNGSLSGTSYTTAPLQGDCSIQATFITHAENAVRHADHRLASDTELLAFARQAIADGESWRQSLTATLWQGITSLTWEPTHDAISFESYQPKTTVSVLPSNVDGDGAPVVRGLVMASSQSGYRMAAMGSNLFSVDTSAETDVLLRHLIAWLTDGADSQEGLRVVTAQVPSRADSWFFPHNEGIRSWLANHYPNSHSINEENSCDYQALGNCIADLKPDLIILSDIDRDNLGHQAIAGAIAKARSAGIPLLLSNYRRSASPMLAPLYRQMGLISYGNYWDRLKADSLEPDAVLTHNVSLQKVDTLLENLLLGHFDTAWLDGCGTNFIDCKAADILAPFKEGADWLRDVVIHLDKEDIDGFTLADAPLLKAALLVADKYRSTIDYPITADEHQAWQQAMFADWLVNYARPDNLPQPDLGEYVIERSQVHKGEQAHYRYPATTSERKQISVPYRGQWTTSAWYALPGQTVTLTRHDASQAEVSVKLNYHRRNTNRAYQQKIYQAPLELATRRLLLKAGQSIRFSSPYGGPIYLYLDGPDGNLNTDITASGIAKHPTLTDFNDPAQIQVFNQRLTDTELPHVDLRTDGAEQHLRRDRFVDAIGDTAADVNALLASIVDDHINTVYTLAGLKIQGKTLEQSLSADVISACTHLFGADCLDAVLHTRKLIQHANYDQSAACGSGCSGNPWDAAWNIDPTGWGDNHELGHNLQVRRLNVHYASATDADYWPGYNGRAGENSNNIFPYVVKWRAHYVRDGHTSVIRDDHMNHKDLFNVFMSDAAQLKDSSGNRVVVDRNCRVLDTGKDRFEAAWQSNAYAAHNGYRMAFNIQMALRAHGMTLADGTRLENGFHLFTLLYQHQRIFGNYAGNATDWAANRDRLGFGMFPFEGHASYGGLKIADIPGNDFMLVSLSRLTGMDWRSHFDLLGLRYSSLAAAQASANASASLPMGMYLLENELPPANLSDGLSFLPLSPADDTTVWQDGSSPAKCQLP